MSNSLLTLVPPFLAPVPLIVPPNQVVKTPKNKKIKNKQNIKVEVSEAFPIKTRSTDLIIIFFFFLKFFRKTTILKVVVFLV